MASGTLSHGESADKVDADEDDKVKDGGVPGLDQARSNVRRGVGVFGSVCGISNSAMLSSGTATARRLEKNTTSLGERRTTA